LKFRINYSDYPYLAKQRIKTGLWLLAFLAAGLIYYTFLQFQSNEGEIRRFQASIDRLHLDMQKQTVSNKEAQDGKKINQKILLANELILKKSFSWTGFLNDLERAIPADISIKKIEPRFNDYSVNLSGEALTLKDLTNLILSLEGKPQFSNVFLLDQKQTKENRIDFLIHLNYKEKEKSDRVASPPNL
jgi:Tfp pilus assembly protein PilN